MTAPMRHLAGHDPSIEGGTVVAFGPDGLPDHRLRRRSGRPARRERHQPPSQRSPIPGDADNSGTVVGNDRGAYALNPDDSRAVRFVGRPYRSEQVSRL
jgi:hypothetical protein